MDAGSEINRLQRVIARLESEGLSHQKLCDQFKASLAGLEQQLDTQSQACLTRQRVIDELENRNAELVAKVYQRDLTISGLEQKLSDLQITWANSDTKSDRQQLSEQIIRYQVLEEETRQSREREQYLQRICEELRVHNGKLQSLLSSQRPQIIESSQQNDFERLINNFETVKQQYAAQVGDLSRQLAMLQEQNNSERKCFGAILGSKWAQERVMLEGANHELEVQVVKAVQMASQKATVQELLEKEMAEMRLLHTTTSQDYQERLKEAQLHIEQKNDIIAAKTAEISKLQVDLNNSGSFLVDTISSIFPNHLEDYLQLKRAHMELQKQYHVLIDAHRKSQSEVKMYQHEIQTKLPFLEEHRKEHETLVAQAQTLKSKLESSLHNNARLLEQIGSLQKTAQADQLQVQVLREQCEKQVKELAKLHVLLRKLKAGAKGDLSVYNVELPMSGEEFDTVEALQAEKVRLELDLRMLSSNSSTQVSKETYLQLQRDHDTLLQRLQEQTIQNSVSAQELAKANAELKVLRWTAENSTSEDPVAQKNGQVYMKEIRKVKKQSQQVETLQLERKRHVRELARAKQQQQQDAQLIEQLQAEVSSLTNANRKLQDLQSEIQKHSSELRDKLRETEQTARRQQESYRIARLELDTMREQHKRVSEEHKLYAIISTCISQSQAYNTLNEEKRLLFRQVLDSNRRTEEAKEQLKQAIAQVLELRRQNHEGIVRMTNLQQEQMQQDKKIQSRVQIENQTILIHSLEERVRHQNQRIIDLQAQIQQQTSIADDKLLENLRKFITSLQEQEQPTNLQQSVVTIAHQQFHNQEDLKTFIEQMQDKFAKETVSYQQQLVYLADEQKRMTTRYQEILKQQKSEIDDLQQARKHWQEMYEREVLLKEQQLNNLSSLSKEESERLQDEVDTQRSRISLLERELNRKMVQLEAQKHGEQDLQDKRNTLKAEEEELEQRRSAFHIEQARQLAQLQVMQANLRSTKSLQWHEIQDLRDELQEERKAVTTLMEQQPIVMSQEDQSREAEQLRANIVELERMIESQNAELNAQGQLNQSQRAQILQLEAQQVPPQPYQQTPLGGGLEVELQMLKEQHQKEREIHLGMIENLRQVRDGLQVQEIQKIKQLIEEGKMLEYLAEAKHIYELQQ